jgi:quinoprotein glucose dehydrogenase
MDVLTLDERTWTVSVVSVAWNEEGHGRHEEISIGFESMRANFSCAPAAVFLLKHTLTLHRYPPAIDGSGSLLKRFTLSIMRCVRTVIASILLLFATVTSEAAEHSDPVSFTFDQASEGQAVYQSHCAGCHGQRLRGSEAAPGLIGPRFEEVWRQRHLGAFVAINLTMPISNPGGLQSYLYESVIAFLLSQNGYPVGERPLRLQSALDSTETLSALGGAAPLTLIPRNRETPRLVEWLHHRGSPHGQNYSALDQIHAGNVMDLGVAWRWRSDNFGTVPWPNYQVTPLMAGGVLYATAGAQRSVVAIDALTGETLWMYRLDEGERGQSAPRKGPGRGVAFHRAENRETVFVISSGYQLIALDAQTGRPVTTFGDGGLVDLKLQLGVDLDPVTAPIGASSPPIVVGDVVIVGAAFAFSGAPESPEALKAKVAAYDVDTGELKWRFNTIPAPGEIGRDTWQGDSADYTGNAGVWAPMSADPELGYVYLPVEAPTSDYYGGHRPGDNLFGQSLVCLDAATGERVWHFQTVHHPIWDYDLPAPPVLLDITVNDELIPAVAQITKQGLTFVFDRRTGEPVWPIPEVAVAQSTVPGEYTAATQPIPTLPEPFGRTGVTVGQLNDLTPEIHAEAMRIVKGYTLGPLYTPPTLVDPDNGGTLVLPGSVGGANWQGAVVDPASGILYVAYAVAPEVVGLISDPERSTMRYILRDALIEGPFDLPLLKPPWSWISALDMNTGKLLWQRPNSRTPQEVREHPKLAGLEIPDTGNDDRSALLVTKTLLFSGEGAGMYGSRWGGTLLRAHDKQTGAVIAEIDLGQRQTGVPMTYSVGGKQFIVVATGAPGEAGQLVALTLK